jgi:uncharacterized GH25 family protein
MRRFHLARSVLRVVCLFLLLTANTAWAVEHHGQVMFNGFPVPGATVSLTLGGKVFSTTTDQQGLYEFPDLPVGTWAVRVEMSGFEPVEGSE